MSKRSRVPSPGTLLGAIALFVALGGFAYAAGVGSRVSTDELARGAVTSQKLHGQSVGPSKIRPNAVRGGKVLDGSLLGADLADNTVTGQQVNESTLGEVPSAAIGASPVAYARVTADGNVDEAFTRGLTDDNVSLQATSGYCFRGLTFAFKTASATPDYEAFGGGVNSFRSIVSVSPGNPFGDCAEADTQFEAATWDSTGAGTFAPAGFFIWFYN